ncbi:MAG TPA: hypothetical protein VF026_19320 [Ktedonobacteraceae bacterium]
MTLWLPALGGCEWAGAGHRGATGDHKGPHPTQLHPRPYGYREAFTTWSGEMGLSIGLTIVERGNGRP